MALSDGGRPPSLEALRSAQRDGYVLEDITTAMKELGFEKKTIHVPKAYRKSARE